MHRVIVIAFHALDWYYFKLAELIDSQQRGKRKYAQKLIYRNFEILRFFNEFVHPLASVN